ncbi:MAG: hypothetical protein WAN93_01040, partial [Solirubrobacteraceae bacterium]
MSDSTAELASSSSTRTEYSPGRWSPSKWLNGSRGVWLPAAIVGGLAFALILWQLAIPRPYY